MATEAVPALMFAFGLVVGSFLNVVIYRLPRGESIAWPGSRCTDCGTPLRPPDLVPILSYLLLCGRCRYCGSRISWRYPAVELLTGVLFLAVYLRSGIRLGLVFGLVLAAASVVVSGIDLGHRRIPNVIVIPLTAVGFASAVLTDRVSLGDSLAGMAVGLVLLGIVAIVSRGGMGMGDVKLLGMIGAWVGWRGVIISLFVGSIAASVVGLLLIATGVMERRHPIPFGPFLSFGGLAVYLYEARLLEMWLG